MDVARKAAQHTALRSVAKGGVKYVLRVAAKSVPFWLRWGMARGQAARHVRRLVRGTAIVWPEAGRALSIGRDHPCPGPGQVLVRACASAVSPGTERAFFLRSPNTSATFPSFPGYSMAGEVVAAGDGAGFRPGELVALAAPHASLAVAEANAVHRVPDGI